MTTISERTQLPHVLLVDDNSGDARLMRMAFKKTDLHAHIIVAETAEIALAILRREGEYADTAHPDLILVDVNLPGINGPTFLKVIKADPVLRLIPALVFSSSNAESDLNESYRHYANGFITKPFSFDDYIDVAKHIVDYWFQFVQTPKVEIPATNDPA